MLISEIYLCSQGEGLLVGVPSILVRTSTCNLRCSWGKNICDTPFTSWEPELNNKMSAQDVYDAVVTMATHNDDGTKRKHALNHCIISGGEPTLWGSELADVVEALVISGIHTTIETNGTKYVELPLKKPEADFTGGVLFSISPKLKSSTPWGTKHEKKHKKLRINLTVLEELLKKYPSYLKFVISSDEDLKEILDIQKKLNVANQRIFLMSEGITPEELLERGARVSELCMKYNFRYSPREHIMLYGNTRRT